MASKLDVDEIAAKDGTSPVTLTKQSAAKAWITYKGTSTNAIMDSLNMSGVVDNGTGDYTMSFTNSMNNSSCPALRILSSLLP